MLGDGKVIFGVACAIDFRNLKSSRKIGFGRSSRPLISSVGGRCSRTPSAEWNLTGTFEGMSATLLEFKQEIGLPAVAVVLAVGDEPEAEILLQAHHVADRRLLDCAGAPASERALSASRALISSGGRIRLPTWCARIGAVTSTVISTPYAAPFGVASTAHRAGRVRPLDYTMYNAI